MLEIVNWLFYLLAVVRFASTISDYGLRAPVIVEQPTDELVTRGQPVTLNCRVSGRPASHVTWYRNGQPLALEATATVQRFFVHEGALYFVQTETEDAGVYQCRAANSFGEVFSQNVTLDIATIGDEFQLSPLDVTVAQSDSARLACVAPPAHPSAVITWQHNGQPVRVTETSRAQLLPSGGLVINDVRHHDQGRYTCVAQNLAGVRESQPAVLTVHVRPFFISQTVDVTSAAGSQAQLTCHVTGDPLPSVSWRRVNSPLPPGRSQVVSRTVLRISSVQVQDEGEYVCLAENTVGRVTGSVTLSVTAPPVITSRSLIAESDVGEKTILPCQVQGRPSPTVYWLREGVAEPLSSSSTHTISSNGSLLMSSPRPGDQGYYLCGAVSGSGSAQLTLELLLRSQPAAHLDQQLSRSRRVLQQVAAVKLAATSLSPSSCVLQWTGRRLTDVDGVNVRYRRESHQESMWITQSLTASGGTSITLTNLKPHTKYQAFVAPFFGSSEGRGSNLVSFTTLEQAPSAAPADIIIQLVNQTNALLRWSPPLHGLMNGRLSGYRLLLWTNASTLRRDYLLNDTSPSHLVTHLTADTRYRLQLAARTSAGTGPLSAPMWFSTGGGGGRRSSLERDWNLTWLAPLIAAAALLGVTVALLVFLVRRHRSASYDSATHCSLSLAKSVVAAQQQQHHQHQQQPLMGTHETTTGWQHDKLTSNTNVTYRHTLVNTNDDAEYAELEPNGPYASTCVIRANPLDGARDRDIGVVPRINDRRGVPLECDGDRDSGVAQLAGDGCALWLRDMIPQPPSHPPPPLCSLHCSCCDSCRSCSSHTGSSCDSRRFGKKLDKSLYQQPCSPALIRYQRGHRDQLVGLT